MNENLILKTEKLVKYYPLKKKFFGKPKSFVKAVDCVDIEIKKGECLGLVGESGSGKSTLSRLILKLERPDSGEIWFNNEKITDYNEKNFRDYRKKIQVIFQDPYSSLNPKHTLLDILTEALLEHKLIKPEQKKNKAVELLELVGLDASHIYKYPHEFSGGQRQRINIARAVSLNPEFIVCDEPVSALDVSVQAQILNLLIDLKEKFNLSYLFITHDLAVVNYMSENIAVMKSGKIVEFGSSDQIINNPQNAYTVKLIGSELNLLT